MIQGNRSCTGKSGWHFVARRSVCVPDARLSCLQPAACPSTPQRHPINERERHACNENGNHSRSTSRAVTIPLIMMFSLFRVSRINKSAGHSHREVPDVDVLREQGEGGLRCRESPQHRHTEALPSVRGPAESAQPQHQACPCRGRSGIPYNVHPKVVSDHNRQSFRSVPLHRCVRGAS